MKHKPGNVPLPSVSVDDRLRLQPFSGVLELILVPRARRVGFRRAGSRSLSVLSRQIDAYLTGKVGHEVDQAITMFALRRACQVYIAAIDCDQPVNLQRAQLHLMDCVWRLTVEIQQHLGLSELVLLVSSI